MSSPRLLIEFGDGSEDEYRIYKRLVIFRSRARRRSHWRRLSPNDILMHLTLRTVVGKWLMLRLPSRTRNTWQLLTKFTERAFSV
jgi:hypothetical protein